MKLQRIAATLSVLVVGVWSLVGLQVPVTGQDRGPERDDDVEVLTRGPIHEAFAQPITFDPKPGIIVPKKPPAPIEEIPPEEKPEGDDIVWIGGYYGWDQDRMNFIWISGIWRRLIPGRQWNPGYWREVAEGYQWVTGYWGVADRQAEYLPPPPASLEIGPSSEAPSVDHLWVNGCWTWYDTRYVWRPGYWILGRPGWTWCPAYYCWTPGGYIYVDGYWDYAPFFNRGVLFAPVCFNPVVYTRPYYYSPSFVIDFGIITSHFFCWPGYNHYCFGNYYGGFYADAGIYPWFSFHLSRGYDPCFAYDRWHHRHDHDWEHGLRADYRHYRDHEHARPPINLLAQQKLVNNLNIDKDVKKLALAKPFKDVIASRDKDALKFERLDDNRRKELAKDVKALDQFREERGKLERHVAAKGSAGQPNEGKPLKLDLPRSPVVGRSIKDDDKGKLDGDKLQRLPPPAPKADLNLRPRTDGEARSNSDVRIDPKALKPKDADTPTKPKEFTLPKPRDNAVPLRPKDDPKPKEATPTPRFLPVEPAKPKVADPKPRAKEATPTPRFLPVEPAKPKIVDPKPRNSTPASRFSPVEPAKARTVEPPRQTPRVTAPAQPRSSRDFTPARPSQPSPVKKDSGGGNNKGNNKKK